MLLSHQAKHSKSCSRKNSVIKSICIMLRSEKERKQQEFFNYKNSCLSSFFPLDVDENNRFRSVGLNSREMVEMDTVDRFLQQKGIDAVDLLKIDTQGFDMEVLLGAKVALQSGVIQNVLVELNFVRKYKGECSPTEIIELLKKYNIVLSDFYEKVRQGPQNKTLAWCTALFCQR